MWASTHMCYSAARSNSLADHGIESFTPPLTLLRNGASVKAIDIHFIRRPKDEDTAL